MCINIKLGINILCSEDLVIETNLQIQYEPNYKANKIKINVLVW